MLIAWFYVLTYIGANGNCKCEYLIDCEALIESLGQWWQEGRSVCGFQLCFLCAVLILLVLLPGIPDVLCARHWQCPLSCSKKFTFPFLPSSICNSNIILILCFQQRTLLQQSLCHKQRLLKLTNVLIKRKHMNFIVQKMLFDFKSNKEPCCLSMFFCESFPLNMALFALQMQGFSILIADPCRCCGT